MRIRAAELVSLRSPSPDRDLTGFRYRVDIRQVVAARGEWIDARVDEFRAAASYPVIKRTGKGDREIDARALVRQLGPTIVLPKALPPA